MLANANPAQRTVLLRYLLRVPFGGQSTSLPFPFPLISKRDQQRVSKLFESVASDPVAFGKLYYGVNAQRLSNLLFGAAKSTVSKLIAEHHAAVTPGDWKGYAEYLDGVTGSTESAPSRLDFLMNGDVLPEATRAMLRAKESIHLSVFHLEPDEVGEQLATLLEKKAKAGVKVRVMVDEYGTVHDGRKKGAPELLERLRAAGVEVVLNPMNTFRSHLDHRKLLVIDGKVGFTGGMNVGVHYQHEWTDQQTRIEGPLVSFLQEAFFDRWLARGGTPPGETETPYPEVPEIEDGLRARVVRHEGGGQDRNIKAAYLRAIQTAQSEIHIANPYFGDDEVVAELNRAAERGVKVTLYFPTDNDTPIMKKTGEAFYRVLLDAGVQIREVEGMSHLKVAMVDRFWTSFGSSNLDARSLEFNDELNCVVLNEGFAADVWNKLFAPSLEASTEVLTRAREFLAPMRRRLATVL